MKILTAMMLVGAMVLALLYSSGLNAEYKSLGLTRHSVIAMLTQEGLGQQTLGSQISRLMKANL